MNKPKHEFDYNMFACTIGFLGIVVLILTI
jgi:hypothetical protein